MINEGGKEIGVNRIDPKKRHLLILSEFTDDDFNIDPRMYRVLNYSPGRESFAERRFGKVVDRVRRNMDIIAAAGLGTGFGTGLGSVFFNDSPLKVALTAIGCGLVGVYGVWIRNGWRDPLTKFNFPW